jgi:hypothetical protein
MFAVKTTWQGDDGVTHYIFDNQGTGANQNRIYMYKYGTNNTIIFGVYDNASAVKRCISAALTAGTWAANVAHIIIVTRSATGVLGGYLDGVPFATPSGGAGTGLETVVGANSYFGSTNAAASPVEGLLLPARWGRELTSAEITALSPPATWASVIDLPQITVTGLATGNAVRLYDAAGNIHASAVEAGGTATLTYTLD